MLNTETVSYVAVTTIDDDLGNVTPTEAAPVSVTALVAGRSNAESTDTRTPAVLVGLTLYFFNTAIVPGASDWFTVRGARYEVEGQAHRWGSMGVEVAVTRASAQP
jgi:hypothetical protein